MQSDTPHLARALGNEMGGLCQQIERCRVACALGSSQDLSILTPACSLWRVQLAASIMLKIFNDKLHEGTSVRRMPICKSVHADPAQVAGAYNYYSAPMTLAKKVLIRCKDINYACTLE